MRQYHNFWQKRTSRRAALSAAVAGGTGAAALFTVGCGGSDKGASKEASSLIATPQDTTSKVVKGSIYQSYRTNDTISFDAIRANNATVSEHSMYVYSRLVKYKVAKYPARADGSVEGDAAASWEISPDGLRYTFKMRPNMKLDPRPPTQGRLLTSDDVRYSWSVFAERSTSRTDLVNAADKNAPVLGVETPDDQTVVFNLAFPYAPLLAMLAYWRILPLMPREAEGGFDPKSEMRGSGAWRLTTYRPSAGFEYRKNPDWYNAANVNFDGIDLPIVSEYAAGLAQFRAGNIWAFGLRAEDILQTKRDLPTLVMLADDSFSRNAWPWIAFSSREGSPFKDDRVRKAASMLMDRDLWIETFYNTQQFTREGLTVPSRWHTHISSGEEAYWLDPKGKELGEGAKFFQYDPAEAKKLLSAAGFSKGVDALFSYPTNANYGSLFTKQAEAFKGMLEANGDFRLKTNNPDYATEWLRTTGDVRYHYGNGIYFDGIAFGAANTYPDIDGHLFNYFRSDSSRVWHGQKDAQLDAIINDQRREVDRSRRIGLIKEFQRYMAKTMYSMIAAGQALGFSLAWPWLGNRGVYRSYDGGGGAAQESTIYLWYDASKRQT